MASLILLTGTLRGTAHRLGPGTTVIGRGESCDVRLFDEQVSRRHAEVRHDERERRYEIIDAGSANGVQIGEERVSMRVLRDGDVITLGDSRLLFTEVEDPEAALAALERDERSKTVRKPAAQTKFPEGY